jgi:uncharacterized protein (DUF1778 family)
MPETPAEPDDRFVLEMTARQKREVSRAARLAGMSVADWVRAALLAEAKRQEKPDSF